MAFVPPTEWARPSEPRPPKRMTASWPGALAGSTECKVAARLLRPLRGSPRFVRDTRLSNPAEHSPPPPLWISGPPPPDSWRSLWRATYPQLPPLSICSRKGSHLEQSPLTENSPCKAQDEVGFVARLRLNDTLMLSLSKHGPRAGWSGHSFPQA